MRLIDADALKVEIADLVVGGERHIYEVMPRSGNDWVDGISSAYREIDNAPTIEPKGKWIEHVDEKWGGVWYTCSNCCQNALYERDVYNIWRQKLSDFCPECGADMRGEE